MDFKELRYVITIAREQSITKAANALYISQPTLTKFLQNLEQRLGQKLFLRVNNHYQPTYAGRCYIERAQQILNLKHEMDVEMDDIIKSDRSELHIGYPRVRATYMLPLTLPVFEQRYPNVHMLVQEQDSPLLEKSLLAGTLDLAFFNGSVQSPGLDQEVLCREEVVLLMHKDNPLAAKAVHREDLAYPWIDLQELRDVRFLIQYPGQKTRIFTDDLFRQLGFTPKKVLETGSLYTSAALASEDYGVCIMSAKQLIAMPHLTSLQRFSFGAPPLDFIAAYRKGSYISRHARAYIDLVAEKLKESA